MRKANELEIKVELGFSEYDGRWICLKDHRDTSATEGILSVLADLRALRCRGKTGKGQGQEVSNHPQ